MVWNSLGTLEPGQLNWQQFPTAAGSGELFRVRQSWVGNWPGTGHLQFSALYGNGGRYGFRRIGSDTEDRLFIMPIPDAMLAAGLTTRHIELRLNTYARIYSGANWQVSLDQWTP